MTGRLAMLFIATSALFGLIGFKLEQFMNEQKQPWSISSKLR